jgi:peptide deformylase
MSTQLPIATLGTEILRKKAKPLNDITGETVELVTDMFYTMRNADGIGLAAPQVNKELDIVTIDISMNKDFEDEKPLILINPEIKEVHGEVLMSEGCLSIPDVHSDVLRPEKIFVKYYDLNMKEYAREYDGLWARVIQHEIDHLRGKLFIDYLPKEDLNDFKDILKKIGAKKIETSYPIYNAKTQR